MIKEKIKELWIKFCKEHPIKQEYITFLFLIPIVIGLTLNNHKIFYGALFFLLIFWGFYVVQKLKNGNRLTKIFFIFFALCIIAYLLDFGYTFYILEIKNVGWEFEKNIVLQFFFLKLTPFLATVIVTLISLATIFLLLSFFYFAYGNAGLIISSLFPIFIGISSFIKNCLLVLNITGGFLFP